MVTGRWISTELVAAIAADAALSPGEERCGLLLGRGGAVERLAPCRNVAADPRAAFEIDPAALFAAHRAARGGGPAVLGCWHSHPGGSATPSARDIAAAATGQLWVIVGGNKVRCWLTGPAPWIEIEAGRIAVATPWERDQ